MNKAIHFLLITCGSLCGVASGLAMAGPLPSDWSAMKAQASRVSVTGDITLRGSGTEGVGCSDRFVLDLARVRHFLQNARPITAVEKKAAVDRTGNQDDFCTGAMTVRLAEGRTVDLLIHSDGRGGPEGKTDYRCDTCESLMEPNFFKPQALPAGELANIDVSIPIAQQGRGADFPCPSLRFDKDRAAYFLKHARPVSALEYNQHVPRASDVCLAMAKFSIGSDAYSLITRHRSAYGVAFLEKDSGDDVPYFFKCDACLNLLEPKFSGR